MASIPMILSRSPYWINYTSNSTNYDYITISLFIWDGNKNDIPTQPTNTFTAYRNKSGTSSTTSINISDYVKSYIKPYLTNEFLEPSIVNDYYNWDGCVWVCWRILSFKITQLISGLNGVVYEDINNFSSPRLATLGYSYFNEGTNSQPPNNLVNQVSRYGLSNDLFDVFHYRVDIDSSTNWSSDIIKRLPSTPPKILQPGIDPCYQLFFLNKNGVWDSLDFNKVFKRSINVKSEEVQNFVSNPHTNSYLVDGVVKVQNINVDEEYILNTDLLNDAQNQIIEQMILSDRWLLFDTIQGTFTSIILIDKKFDEKVGRNDKANIQWSFKFKLGYNKINDIK